MVRPKKRKENLKYPRLTKRQRAILDVLVTLDNLQRTDIVDEKNELIKLGLIEGEWEGPGVPTAAGRALSQIEFVEPEPEGRNYKEDAAELAGAVIGFIGRMETVSNDHAYLLQFAKDVLAGKVRE